jgi:ubiquinone/menaquinone biosynthesis C-methylase UbiE
MNRNQSLTSRRLDYFTPYYTDKIEYPDNSFDLIILNDVLYKLSNNEDFIDEIYRILKPNGVVMIKDYDCIHIETQMLVDIKNSMDDEIVYNNLAEEYFVFTSKYYRTKHDWMTLFSTKLFTVFNFSKVMEKKLQKILDNDPLRPCYFAAQKNNYSIDSI